jgi:hypothetical protein
MQSGEEFINKERKKGLHYYSTTFQNSIHKSTNLSKYDFTVTTLSYIKITKH